AASSWPLHVTIVAPFSSAEAPDALGAALAEFASVHAPIAAIAGQLAMFGARRTVPFVLIEPSGELRSLHLDALAWLEERGVVLRLPRTLAC
ncbi:2'-5' RNA ligase family protein, partial [Rhizobium johnstonii]|uniref:2'-5' RNA ligase family protein n=1 Tax=Rhizobium johnstonii TaxID=3019933 RepID=UPI003F9A4088